MLFGSLKLIFRTIKLSFFHHPHVSLLNGNDLNLYIWFNTKLPNKNGRCQLATTNPKAKTKFVHTLINTTLKYLL
jgi:hypothetical protein